MSPHRPIPIKKWRKFLTQMGCEFEGIGKHEKWNRDDLLRPIMFRHSETEIPATHVRTNLETLGMSWKDFEEVLKKL